MVLGGIYRRLLLSLNDRAYGMPSRLQDAAGSRNRRKDAALEAVGIPLATEFRRVLQNYIKRSTKYLFDYNRRLFKKLQMQGAARFQAEAYSLYVEH
ncbi:MAG: hypothetical protein VR68_12920 [Peptococcaceae bacterium BRH_c4a]|nr:MAG: hypothetical protein VR68_12920 [Peptococcaceae bacterium BRH_c4a]